jgi:hypothetical protein
MYALKSLELTYHCPAYRHINYAIIAIINYCFENWVMHLHNLIDGAFLKMTLRDYRISVLPWTEKQHSLNVLTQIHEVR